MSEDDKLLHWAVKGDPQAFYYLQLMFWVLNVWDDLIDKDKPITDGMINQAFHALMVDIPRNPFYKAHSEFLLPILNSGIADYIAANDFESRSDDDIKRISFVIRNNISAIITQCAYLIGGYKWMAEVTVKVNEYIHNDDFEQYLQELK